MLTWVASIALGRVSLLAPTKTEQPLDGVIGIAEQGRGQVIVAVRAVELEAVVAGVPVWYVNALAQPVGRQKHHRQCEGCNASHLQEPQHSAIARGSVLQSTKSQSLNAPWEPWG